MHTNRLVPVIFEEQEGAYYLYDTVTTGFGDDVGNDPWFSKWIQTNHRARVEKVRLLNREVETIVFEPCEDGHKTTYVAVDDRGVPITLESLPEEDREELVSSWPQRFASVTTQLYKVIYSGLNSREWKKYGYQTLGLGTLDRLSGTLEDLGDVVKQQNDEELAKRLYGLAERTLTLLETFKGERNTRANRIVNRAERAVLTDKANDLKYQAEIIKEAFNEKPNTVPSDELRFVSKQSKEASSYLWFSRLADLYRLRAKLKLSKRFTIDDQNSAYDDLVTAEKHYEETLEFAEPDRQSLIWKRWSETILLRGNYLIERYSPDCAWPCALKGLELCELLLGTKEGQQIGSRDRYLTLIRQGQFYFLSAQITDDKTSNEYCTKAKETYEQARNERSGDYIAYEELVNLHLFWHDVRQAINVLDDFREHMADVQRDNAKQVKRSIDWIEYRTAEILAENGFVEEAGRRLVSILTITQPWNEKAATLFANLMKFQADPVTAESLFDDLVKKLNPDYFTVAQATVISALSQQLGTGYEWLKDNGNKHTFGRDVQESLAKYYFDLARKEAPGSDVQRNYLGKSLEFNKPLENADPYARYDLIAWTRRARIEMFLNRLDEAEQLLKALYEKHHEDPYIPFHMGECLQRKGDYSGALGYFREAYNRAPRIDTTDRIAFSLFRLGEFDAAIEELRGILQEHPEDASALYSLGAVCLERDDKGDVERARDYWLQSVELKTLEGMPSGKQLYEAKVTTRALVSLLRDDVSHLSVILAAVREQNPYMASILVDQFTTLSLFHRNVADGLLTILMLNRPFYLKRRIAQYCMGRAIFLSLGIARDEALGAWIERATTTIQDAGGKALISEFLAGAKGSYSRALRELVGNSGLSSEARIAGVGNIVAAGDVRIFNGWVSLYKHIYSSISDPDYYRRTEELVRDGPEPSGQEFTVFVSNLIRKLLIKNARDSNIYPDLEELRKCWQWELFLGSRSSHMVAIEKSMQVMTKCPLNLMLWQLGSLQKRIQASVNGIKVQVDGVDWDRIRRLGMWVDGESISQFGKWCVWMAANSGNDAVVIKWKVSDDGSVSCIFKTDRSIILWPSGADKFMAINSARKTSVSEGIGFVLPQPMVFPTQAVYEERGH